MIFQIAVLFSFIFIGFTIRQGGFLPENSAEIFSKLENRILMPAVVINTFRTNCTVKNISEKWVFIAYSTGVLLFCIATGFVASRFLGKTEYLKKVYRYSVSNFGFVGTAMVSGIYGAESMELFDYLMFTLPLNLFTYSIGIAWLVPNGHGKFSMKNFVNPIFVSIFIGAILGLLPIPKFRLVTTINQFNRRLYVSDCNDSDRLCNRRLQLCKSFRQMADLCCCRNPPCVSANGFGACVKAF